MFTSLDAVTRRTILEAPTREIVLMLEHNVLAKFRLTPEMQQRERRKLIALGESQKEPSKERYQHPLARNEPARGRRVTISTVTHHNRHIHQDRPKSRPCGSSLLPLPCATFLGLSVQRYRNKISGGGSRRRRGHSGANDKRFTRENGIVEELY